MTRKLIPILLLILLSGTSALLADAARKPKGGIIVMEAELFDDNIAQGEAEWILNTDVDGYSRGGYMQALPTTAGRQDDPIGDSPRLDFNIEVGAGTYYVWGRAQADNSSQNSFHIGLNGAVTGNRVDVPDGQGWVWVSDKIEITEPNVYTINCWMREAGICVDKLILTTDSDYVPSGYGPRDPRLGPAMTIEPSIDMVAINYVKILSIHGNDVDDLMLGTTTFAEETHVIHRTPDSADNFNLRSVADAIYQPYVETMFDLPVETIFIVESGGCDSGYMQPLDKNRDVMDDPIPFSEDDFANTGYGVRNGPAGMLAVITLEPMTYGIRILPPDDSYMGIDLLSVSGIAGPIIKAKPIESLDALTAAELDPNVGDPNTLVEVLAINGIDVSKLILGTTTADFEKFPDHPATDADNFDLTTYGSLDNANVLQTVFAVPVTTVFVLEKDGNDGGYVLPLDADGLPIGGRVTFTPDDFLKTETSQRTIGGMVITPVAPIHGIRLWSTDIDVLSVSGVPAK